MCSSSNGSSRKPSLTNYAYTVDFPKQLWFPSVEDLREAFQVGRPAMGLVTSSLYLYNNPNPSLWMALYFGYIFQLGCNAGNDYMDWERDMEEQGREFSVSRGKARSKNHVWWHYMFATVVSYVIAIIDPLFGALYFVITELAGHLAYNGIFLGFAVHEISIVKSVGFPLDVVVAAWTYMPFAYLVGQRSWFPDLTIAAWGTTMLWAQIKDYHHEKHTKVRTTATVLGFTGAATIVCLAAAVMAYQDPRLLPYAVYTFYRCYVYPDPGVKLGGFGKMSVIMALNLVGVVLCDSSISALIKYTTFGSHVLSFLAYKYSYVCEQKYYAVMSVVNRRRPYDRTVWNEPNPHVLLWKVGGLIGRSGSAAMGFMGYEYARLCLMGYIIFRAQDTWADVCLDSEDRIKGLTLVPKRLDGIRQKNKAVVGVPDAVEHVRWDFESRERNRLYVDVTKNVHRFDEVYASLPDFQQEILATYAQELGEGWSELERLKDAPITDAIMRKHAEVAIDAGFYGMCKGMAPKLFQALKPGQEGYDPKAGDSYISYSDFTWYLNLVATIEEDVKEGVALDPELQAMKGELKPDVIKRVRIRWLVRSLIWLQESKTFLCHPHLVSSWGLRMFVLVFLKTSIDVAKKYTSDYEGKIFKRSGGKALLVTVIESLKDESYVKSVCTAIASGDQMLEKLKLMQE